MSEEATKPARRQVHVGVLIAIAVIAAGASAAITALIANISERKGEARTTYSQVVALDEKTWDPAVWGQNFPVQYDAYLGTAEFTPTAHNEALVTRTPTAEDDRTATTASKLEQDPRLVTMWSGYAFALDYRHLRGHEWMLKDQQTTLRVLMKDQPGACLNCHASTPPVMDELGNGDQLAGFAAMNKMPYSEASALAEHPIACVDCHDPETMNLRISRPAFAEGIKNLKASEGIADYEVNKDATDQEMRSYVCAQCHVEYDFAGEDKTLTFPWNNGTDIDDVWDYYQEIGFTDFEHKVTEAGIVKAQHPEFEAWSAGVHAANGVSCADCHMNYERVGAQKVSNHDVTTPMTDVKATCGVCHTASEQVIRDRVTTIQNRFVASRDRALDSLTQLIAAIEQAKSDGTPSDQLELAKKYQNKASFYIDYAYSENSFGFHAPDYFARIITTSLDMSRLGQLALLGVPEEQLEPSDVAKANAEHVAETGLK
ncbi:MAG: ammonia-forming cytochrome c nitrite reductase subunit c552 [Bifidobacteriaceae bacterium]|nr:ammonia-forming cytochrome c nitrite reductase subunit c552 [Bifidobacteriaceae bacterium]